jgi:hypothetical protein
LSLNELSTKKWSPGNRCRVINFLSFQDAFDYLIKAYSLEGQKILLPSFYCDATVRNMSEKLRVILCQVDRERIDVNYDDFVEKIRLEKPRVIILYNFLGMNSLLYRKRDWLRYVPEDTVIISDFAHSLLPNHRLLFLSKNHFYIDSARKCTPFMIAHLIAPEGFVLQKNLIRPFNMFKIYVRLLFFLKNKLFRLAQWTKSTILEHIATAISIEHNRLIGERITPNRAFSLDHLLYCHINFERIVEHRRMLFHTYRKTFRKAKCPHIQQFHIPESEAGNLCFYFMRIASPFIPGLRQYLSEKGYLIDQIWDFEKFEGINEHFREWAQSIVLFPYSMHTRPSDVRKMAEFITHYFRTHALPYEIKKLVS